MTRTRDHADFSRNQFLRVNQDGGKGGGQDDPNDDGEDAGPKEIGVGENEGEGRNAEDRNPDDQLASIAIADWSTENRAEGDGKKEKEQVELRPLDREMKFVNQVKGVVVR